jgi:diguanylate cyclase (GGDEF)-like protein
LRLRCLTFSGIYRPCILGIALQWLAPPACHAQRYSFTDTTEGLGNLNVNCIAQDRTGYLWVGTENGLYRYDGFRFKEYGAAEGIAARTIQNLFVDIDGTLWAGATTGVYFERKDGVFAEVRPPAPVDGFSQRIGAAFTALSSGRVAMADRAGGFLLRRVAPEQWVAEPMHLEGERILSVLAGAKGELWYGCDKDLCLQSNGRTTRMRAPLGLPEDDWLHLLRAKNGHIWIRGIVHTGEFDPAGGRYTPRDLPGRTNPVPYLAIAEDAQGRVVATQGADFRLWQDGQWRMVTARNGLSLHDLAALFVDREGSLWIGLVGHGLMRWLGQRGWQAYTTQEGLSNDIVWASLRDSKGRMWIGSEAGVDYLSPDGATLKSWTKPGFETARAVTLTEADGIWVGSAVGNLVRIDENTLAARQWKIPEAYRLVADGHRLWIATAGGLFSMETQGSNQVPKLVEDAAIANPHTRFTDLCLDASHRLWAAADNGFFMLDSGGWKRIDPGLAAVNPSLIASDRKGNLWVAGPSFAGIVRLRVGGGRVVEAEHIGHPPLLSEQVVALMVDHRGWLWLGQDAGVSVYDGRAWRSFTQDDGLIWNDTDTNGLTEDPDGSIWIGTSGGISHFIDPAAAPVGPPQEPVFSDVKFGALNVENGAQIPWSASAFSVTMSALSFRDQRHVRMRYRMEGLEPDWVETSESSVRYPRLSPGSYRFEAESVDISTGEASPARVAAFRITSMWWQNPLLPLGFSMAAGIAAVLLVRMRVRRLQNQKRQLEVAVQRRTEDLEREKLELLDARDQLRHYAEHDGLTGLWNHRIIIDRLRNEIDRSQREGTPIGVIIADLDHFKHINDTFGHPAGDLVLKEIGDIFVRSVRSYDWVGRYGGEEFLLILPGSGFLAARSRAEQLRAAVDSVRVRYAGASIAVTASFGVACGFPANYEIIVQAADAALYRAKDNGRNCVMAVEVPQVTER